MSIGNGEDKLHDRVLQVEFRVDRHREAIDKLEQNQERLADAVRKIGWIMATSGVVIAASSTGLLATLGKLVAIAP